MAFIFFALTALFLTAILPTSSAQTCPQNGPFFFDYVQGTCNSDPSNPANLQILFEPAQRWSTHITVNAQVTFRGTNNALTGVAGFPRTTWAADGSNTATMNFDLPLSAIPAGSVVTQRVFLTEGSSCFWGGSAFYTQIHQPTAKTTDSYTTITTTIPETTTTTSVLVETAVETSTPPEVTATSITGYKTLWAKRVTSTKTSTVTPRPLTKYSITVVKTTTTVTCLGGGNNRRAMNEKIPDVLAERQEKTYEMPDCFGVRTTTIYTSTIQVPATTTTTGKPNQIIIFYLSLVYLKYPS
jgi:hypothetical protein